jgi:50S ribosomal protein L16 3-hydroxylase
MAVRASRMKPARLPANRAERGSIGTTAAAPFALPSRFWSRFDRQYWGRKPVVLKQPFGSPLATPDEAFLGLVSASDRFRKGDRTTDLSFYIEYANLLANVAEYIPEASDQSLPAYLARVSRQLQGRCFGLIVQDFQMDQVEIWFRLRQFLRGLYEQVGMPRGHAKATVFLGNYQKTPFGLHQGDSNNFQFVVAGAKRLRLWPADFFRHREDMSNRIGYERYLDGSIVLDAEPGDLIYWPAGYWHIGESVGGYAMGISVALFGDFHPSELCGHAVRMMQDRWAIRSRGAPNKCSPAQPRHGVADLKRWTAKVSRDFQKVCNGIDLGEALKLSLLNRFTGFGFATVPPPLAGAGKGLADSDSIRARTDAIMAWMPAAVDEIICSANGHAFSMAAHPNMLKLLKRLSRGGVARVQALISKYAGAARKGALEFDASPEAVRALLEKLHALRAVIRAE